MNRRLFLLALGLFSVIFSGCESAPERQREVTTIPWNRPQKWEGTGSLGGMPASQ
ncbi:MAG: hypothetical protein SGI71_05850 [Verrucomicrobiota bacterium]|nr:hypothetical protein [Verrucomicrobiota bacterium]